MNTNEVLDVFREAGAVLEGHFILTSGLRSPIFLQKARVFMHADKTERVCRGLAEKIEGAGLGQIDYVVGPAIGGIIPAYETSRHLGVPAIWVERENGIFKLRRFEIAKGARVVIVEDIVTTGLSIRETVTCLQELGADVLAAACIIDRSAGKSDVGVPLIALAEYEVPAYPADDLPPELAAIPPVKPGSRNI
ncbi:MULTISPECIES: orotate phosphoribosyltransferase [Phyllobacterium]|jgi:orotate phosphoribosyltransferase|uniref:Orotate phosphoribosyltransferase n=1 Tax=Phyllobacterium trifolii TaxID=300193 RepID=A0A839U2C3_9HYPH|nr:MULTISPECIES: orotate phosphoribosyltransferase [Phyllobacterium]MBB3144123.1 orotate phosphoribosyltransferase [Phyllobacterium trifolii]MBZ9600572.1 orotate phosphoribosyltransferase [Phyllobacterium sp. KW56]